MTESGDPRDNAIAERVNGILKIEWLNQMNFSSFKSAQQAVNKVVWLYNNRRKHSSIALLTPEQAHHQQGPLLRQWRHYWKKSGGKEGTYANIT